MSALLTPRDVAAVLSVRDRRTVLRRLADLAVPVVPFGRSYRVRSVDLERALSAGAAVLTIVNTRPPAGGVTLAPGARLWDSDPSNHQVSPRRVNARARGTRNETPVRVKPTEGPTAPLGSLPRASEQEETS